MGKGPLKVINFHPKRCVQDAISGDLSFLFQGSALNNKNSSCCSAPSEVCVFIFSIHLLKPYRWESGWGLERAVFKSSKCELVFLKYVSTK